MVFSSAFSSGVPTLYTPRLILRPFSIADALRVQELAGDKCVAAMTALIPHPYPDGLAKQWIESQAARAADKSEFAFAITLTGTRTPNRENDIADTGHLIGAIELARAGDAVHNRGSMGYWIGVPYWNKGFATEAGRAVLDFAFDRLQLHRVVSDHFATNPASGRVMQKLGMTCEGTLRGHFLKWGEYLDVVKYGILAAEWRARRKPAFASVRVRELSEFLI